MKKYSLAISFLIIAASIYISFSLLLPKKVSDLSTPLTEFSTERALIHLKEISKKPHYVGTKEHKKVQEYIVAELENLGLQVEIQEQVAVNKTYSQSVITQNILAKIKGTDNSKALLLLSHYDAGPHSALGASDAGSGVVTILEGLRAFLAKNKLPNNDIIILISDAEEVGLLGANAFVNFHPWAKNVGLVLNFEARGSGGPSFMLLETNGGNKNLIQNFKKANPDYPVTTSLMYSIYKMLPNDTDLTVFREDGNIDGFNFAFIDDHFDYHTVQDSYERLDRKTLEHQGTYLMPLLSYFADADLTNLKSNEDYVYFNFPIIGMVIYPFSWIIPMLILVVLIFLGLLIYGISKQKIKTKQIFKGFIPLLLSLTISGLLAHYGWQFLKFIHPQYKTILHGFTYNGNLYIAAFSALTLAICFIVYKKYFKKNSSANLLIAPITFWVLINVAVSLFLKGAGFFIIAAIYGVICLTILLFSKASEQNKQLVFSILAIPIIIIFVPMIQMFPVGLGLKMLAISTVLIVFLFSLFIPVFRSFKNIKLGRLFLFLAFIIFITASFRSDYNENRKKTNNIVYVLDAYKNEAFWASYDRKVDDFTKQFLGDNPVKGKFGNSTTARKYKLHKKTDVKNIHPPLIEIVADTIIENDRKIHLTVTPQRKSNRIIIKSKNPIAFKSFIVNGNRFSKYPNSDYVFYLRKPGRAVLSHYYTKKDEVLDLQFTISNDSLAPQFTLYEIAYDLFENQNFNFKPRTENMMPTPFIISDATTVKKRILFNKNNE